MGRQLLLELIPYRGAGEITMAKRKRDMQLNFRVSAEELAVIEQKMSQFGTSKSAS